MKQKFIRFMYGRNGADNLTRFVSTASVVVLLISMFIGGMLRSVLFAVAVLMLVYSYFRMFSKNLTARRKENAKYVQQKQRLKSWWNLRREMWKQRKEFKFFKCPSCKAVLRVPSGKGKIRIVCKKCGTSFEKKT